MLLWSFTETAVLICSHTVYGCFDSTKAKLSSCDEDHMAHKAKNIYYQGLLRKSLPITVLKYEFRCSRLNTGRDKQGLKYIQKCYEQQLFEILNNTLAWHKCILCTQGILYMRGQILFFLSINYSQTIPCPKNSPSSRGK